MCLSMDFSFNRSVQFVSVEQHSALRGQFGASIYGHAISSLVLLAAGAVQLSVNKMAFLNCISKTTKLHLF